jgi:hypothetical protein
VPDDNSAIPDFGKTAAQILQFLNQWQDEKHLYDLEQIHSMEFYGGEYLDVLRNGYFGEGDLTSYFKDRFWGFAVDGAGGDYALWYYPGLDKEPPVVFIGSEGEMEMLAANMEDFLNRIINDITFRAGWVYEDASPQEMQENLTREYDDLADHYQDAHGVTLSEEEVAGLLDFLHNPFTVSALHSWV